MKSIENKRLFVRASIFWLVIAVTLSLYRALNPDARVYIGDPPVYTGEPTVGEFLGHGASDE